MKLYEEDYYLICVLVLVFSSIVSFIVFEKKCENAGGITVYGDCIEAKIIHIK